MGIIDSFIKLDIRKLFLNGRIDKAYEQMYNVAERIAIHELRQRSFGVVKKAGKKFLKDPSDLSVYPEEIAKYKEKRIEYHMNRMEKLLKLREELTGDYKEKKT